MTIYVRGENPIWFFNNLTGQVLDDTYWAFFLTNDLPYVPQAVYQDPNGASPWSNPLEFQPSGGLPNNLYFDPSLTYRIEIRQGPLQTDPLIWLIQNYVPGSGSGGVVTDNPLISAPNLITNPQFADIYFESPFTYTEGSVGTYTLDIAPGWQLILTGSGTTVLTQGTNPGSDNLFGNPAYFLEINNTGWTTATLVQTLNNNGSIFANGAVAVAFTAQAIGSNEIVTVVYDPNGTSNAQNIFSGTINTGGFGQYYGVLPNDLNPVFSSMNSNEGEAANVRIEFVLPTPGIVELSNIQVVGQSTPLTSDFDAPTSVEGGRGSVPNYQELTYEQMVNAEFHLYKNAMLNQSKDSLLTAWNFANNPWQFRTTAATNLANNAYTADQTIVVQQAYVTSATANNISVGQGTAAENQAFKVTAVTATNKFAIIQYIDPATIRSFWGKKLSSMVTGSVLSPTHSTQCKFKMRLIYRTTLPPTISQTEPISSWTNVDGSDPVFTLGWTEIEPLNDPEYTFGVATTESFNFNQFQLPASSAAAMTLAVVVYTTTNLDQTATADAILIDDVSLVPNDFALPTQAETFDQTLKKCEYYYEKSYDTAVLPGTADPNSELAFNQGFWLDGGNYKGYAESFGITYRNLKRAVPTTTLYAPSTGTAPAVDSELLVHGASLTASPINWTTYWASVSAGRKGCAFDTAANLTFLSGADPGGNGNIYCTIKLHYTADARLGM
jgi:hypothetical protein